jgi:hypothetical protein
MEFGSEGFAQMMALIESYERGREDAHMLN